MFHFAENDNSAEIEILRVNATDADSEENARVTYSLLKDSPGVRIVSETGAVLATGTMTSTSLNLAVVAQDAGKPPRKTVAALRLRVPAPTQTRHIFAKDDHR